MNDSLIKQLELAIAVIKGEVTMQEIEKRLRAEYISRDKTQLDWYQPQHWDEPERWNHKEYEYRRKPKPLEIWMNERTDGFRKFFASEEQAWDNAENERVSLRGPYKTIAKKLREVTNE